MNLSFLTPPEFLSLPIFGLDISHSSIKISKLKRIGTNLVPEIIVDVPVSDTAKLFDSTNQQGSYKDVKLVLNQLKKKHKINWI